MSVGGARKLGVYSLGFLWQPELRRRLADAGWRVQAGLGATDAVGVWGRRGVAARGRAAARLLGKPLITLEDGFLRSVSPGARAPIISLILDDIGVYYDASRPSRLERIIEQGPTAAPDVAAAALSRLRAARLSKYNFGPDLEQPPRDHVLVVDQTRGDASIRWGGADAEAFARMLDAARAEHPGAEIIVKSHPETALGRKRGHFDAAALRPGESLYTRPANPWDLIEGARAVYTVSSQLGFEALMARRPVRVFGQPFYAGWGATEDEAPPISRRSARRGAADLFAAAYLDYPLYFDPWRGGVTDFDAALSALSTLKAAHDANRRPAVAVGVRLWKRAHVARFLGAPTSRVTFEDTPAKAVAQAVADDARLVVWASKANPELDRAAAAKGRRATRIEDGFLRSVGLGAALTPPLSLSVDDLGIYYDPSRPSRLEALIETRAAAKPAVIDRAVRLRRALVELNLTKYNLAAAPPAFAPPDGARVVLVPGQVEDDASVLTGAGETRTNAALLAEARRAAPDAFLVYKPHPDVEAGLRPGAIEAAEADHVAVGVDAGVLLNMVNEVWTITSLMGFEALLRGRRVACLGAPFYAGWGLTEDRGPTPARRRVRPSLDALTYAALIDYPRYRDPVTGLPCEVEVIVERLSAGVSPRRTGLGALSKLQGLFASQSWLWR